jgi:hypothetical protein
MPSQVSDGCENSSIPKPGNCRTPIGNCWKAIQSISPALRGLYRPPDFLSQSATGCNSRGRRAMAVCGRSFARIVWSPHPVRDDCLTNHHRRPDIRIVYACLATDCPGPPRDCIICRASFGLGVVASDVALAEPHGTSKGEIAFTAELIVLPDATAAWVRNRRDRSVRRLSFTFAQPTGLAHFDRQLRSALVDWRLPSCRRGFSGLATTLTGPRSCLRWRSSRRLGHAHHEMNGHIILRAILWQSRPDLRSMDELVFADMVVFFVSTPY